MEEVLLIERSYELIRKDFGLEGTDPDESIHFDFEWLLRQLTLHVNYLLDHDFNKLMNALYRIDIGESQVNEILTQSKSGEIGKEIARAIIEREKQKVITRQKYRKL